MGSDVMTKLQGFRPTEQQYGMRPDMNTQMAGVGMNPAVGAPQMGLSAPTRAPFQVSAVDQAADQPSPYAPRGGKSSDWKKQLAMLLMQRAGQ